MARGRPSVSASATPAASSNASRDASASGGRRVTRNSLAKGTPDLQAVNQSTRSASPDPLLEQPRFRPTRTSLLAMGNSIPTPSPLVTGGQVPAFKRARGRLSSTRTADSASVSSALTRPESSSEDDYSTPGTSKVPTPAATDLPASARLAKTHASIQVQLPSRQLGEDDDGERALRSSKYSLKPALKHTGMEIDDSEDDGDLSDFSPDAKVARRLQAEEFASQDDYGFARRVSSRRIGPRSSLGKSSAANVASSYFPAPQSTKRGRADTASAEKARPVIKKTRLSSKLDLDAELAAAAAYDSDASMSESNPEFGSDEHIYNLLSATTDSEWDVDSDSEDLPAPMEAALKVTAKVPAKGKEKEKAKGKTKGRTKGTANAAPHRPSVKARGAARPSKSSAQQHTVESETLPFLAADDDDGLHTHGLIPGDGYSSSMSSFTSGIGSTSEGESDSDTALAASRRGQRNVSTAVTRRGYRDTGTSRRQKKERDRLEAHHPELKTMWDDLENTPVLNAGQAPQPSAISRQLKPFQLEGLAWMIEMEKREWKGGLLGDEMGLGKTIQAVSLIMSDYPAKQPSLVLVPPVALMQWQSEINSYTDGTLNTFVYHGTNQKTKGMTLRDLKKYDVIMMSYNSLESMYRKQEKGFKRKDGLYKEKSLIHSIDFHRIILDEAHSIKTRTTMTAKACFALKTGYRWCLTGTPLQNRIGEFFSLLRFLNVQPFASYLCKQCPCSTIEWTMDGDSRCSHCKHAGMQHVSVFNQELLNPIQKFGNLGRGREAFRKLRLMTDRIMLRRLKKDHTNAMELPVKEIYVDRQFFGEEENDFANSIMTNGQRKFDTYVAQGVLLNNYANIFGLIMQMRQVADHPDLLLKKNAEGGQNVLVCCICDEPAEDTVRSRCKHDFCRTCVASYVRSTDAPDCPRCHIPLSVDLEQPEIEQDEALVKKTSIINRIKMENWTSSSKIELLVHELHKLRSDNASHKSIIFSQFTTMLQLIEWRLRRAGITTVMLDGSMTPAQRQASIEHFMTNVDVECFLVSLKAGGVALNLTEASRVFIVDPWWNPAAEWQSADRCHRIGQTRPCTITRLCIEDSVESRMVLIQEKKTNMINSTVNADDKAMDSLSPEDMQFLFRGS